MGLRNGRRILSRRLRVDYGLLRQSSLTSTISPVYPRARGYTSWTAVIVHSASSGGPLPIPTVIDVVAMGSNAPKSAANCRLIGSTHPIGHINYRRCHPSGPTDPTELADLLDDLQSCSSWLACVLPCPENILRQGLTTGDFATTKGGRLNCFTLRPSFFEACSSEMFPCRPTVYQDY